LLTHKDALGLSLPAGTTVGESWELSAGVELPSVTLAGEPLAALLAREPQAMLGDEATAGRRTTALVVKWLDAGDDLSLQIHPEDDTPGLRPGEGGKVEAWYVIAHEPGARVYLGFRPEVSEREVKRVLALGDDLSALMAQRPVRVGDLIVLDPGTPHAIGRGITLLEPQQVTPDKRALTYRYWDWNRRYDDSGMSSPLGAPRALHVAEALACTRWERATDPVWLASRCHAFGAATLHGPARCEVLCAAARDPGAPALRSEALRIARLSGSGALELPGWPVLRSLTVFEGSVVLGSGEAALRVPRGTTVAIPAACGALPCALDAAHALVCAVAS
jgi:mannose-6-phosphate isomerase